MILGREGWIILENLQREERQIYMDAADSGVPHNADTIKRIQGALDHPFGGLKDLEYGKPTKNEGACIAKQQSYFCPIERSNKPKHTDGCMITIYCMTIPKRYQQTVMRSGCYEKPLYYTFEFKRVTLPDHEWDK